MRSVSLFSRRSFLDVSGALAARLLADTDLPAKLTLSGRAKPFAVEGFGPLVRDPQRPIDLPRGFTYQTLSRAGETMDDGLLVPGEHDGMAAFAGRSGRIVLIRSHQLTESSEKAIGPFGPDNRLLSLNNRSLVYDPGRGDPPLAARNVSACP